MAAATEGLESASHAAGGGGDGRFWLREVMALWDRGDSLWTHLSARYLSNKIPGGARNAVREVLHPKKKNY